MLFRLCLLRFFAFSARGVAADAGVLRGFMSDAWGCWWHDLPELHQIYLNIRFEDNPENKHHTIPNYFRTPDPNLPKALSIQADEDSLRQGTVGKHVKHSWCLRL